MSITCPRCGAESANPNDEREGYCGRCHDWTRADRLIAADVIAPGYAFEYPELVEMRNVARRQLDGSRAGAWGVASTRMLSKLPILRWSATIWEVDQTGDHLDVRLRWSVFGVTHTLTVRRAHRWAEKRMR